MKMDYRTIKPLYTVMDSPQRKKVIDDFYDNLSDDATDHELSTKIAELKLYSDDLFGSDGMIIQPDRIDSNIKELITLMNGRGIGTKSSCEGHSKYEQFGGSGPYIYFGRIRNRSLFNNLARELSKQKLISGKGDHWTFSADVYDNWDWSYRGGKEKYWSKIMEVVTPIFEADTEFPKKRTSMINKLLGR